MIVWPLLKYGNVKLSTALESVLKEFSKRDDVNTSCKSFDRRKRLGKENKRLVSYAATKPPRCVLQPPNPQDAFYSHKNLAFGESNSERISRMVTAEGREVTVE